jgi:hypothetical protein
MAPELHVAHFWRNSEDWKKIGTKILDVDNNEVYRCAKNQSEIRCIFCLTKNDKCGDLGAVHILKS